MFVDLLLQLRALLKTLGSERVLSALTVPSSSTSERVRLGGLALDRLLRRRARSHNPYKHRRRPNLKIKNVNLSIQESKKRRKNRGEVRHPELEKKRPMECLTLHIGAPVIAT